MNRSPSRSNNTISRAQSTTSSIWSGAQSESCRPDDQESRGAAEAGGRLMIRLRNTLRIG
jgi:hypothetical protein